MLNPNFNSLIIRFIICWLIPAFLFSWAMRIEQIINYKYKIGNDWSYALNNPWIIGFALFYLIFFVICVFYFIVPVIFHFNFKGNYGKFIWTTFVGLVVILALSMNSIGSHNNIFSSFRPLIVVSLIGLSVPLTDSMVKKWIKIKK